MKLSVFDRVLVFISSLVMLVVGILLILMSVSAMPVSQVAFEFQNFTKDIVGIAMVIIIAAIFILMSVKLILALVAGPSNGTSHETSQKIVLQKGEFGDIMVSSDLVKDLAVRFAKNSEDVKDVECKIMCEESGVKILIKFFMKKDVTINEFMAKIQKEMKEYVEMYSGVNVLTIDMCADVNSNIVGRLR